MNEALSRQLETPLRVLVVAKQPVVRAGLRGLLEEVPGIVVVGPAIGQEQAVALAIEQPADVAFAAWEGAEAAAALAEALGTVELRLLLLGEAPSPAELSQVLQAGVRGFLLADTTADDAGAALSAVARGLLVLDPLLAPALRAVESGRAASAASPSRLLTEREREVLELVAQGLPNKAIARQLGMSEHTVKFHVGSILAKLEATNRTEAVTRAARRGLLAL